MYSTSDSFKSIIKSDKRTFALRVTLNSSTEMTGTTIQDVTLDEVINSSETLTMGCACSNKVTINLINPPTDIDYENMTIKVENNEYKLIKNYKDGFDEENFKNVVIKSNSLSADVTSPSSFYGSKVDLQNMKIPRKERV